MTSHADSEDKEKHWKSDRIQIPRKKQTSQRSYKRRNLYQNQSSVELFWKKNKEMLQDRQLHISMKKQVLGQCVLPTMTYGCQTWSLNKQLIDKQTENHLKSNEEENVKPKTT